MTLGLVGVLVSVAALAVDRLSPRNFQSFPVDIWSPVVSSVYVNFDNPSNSHSAYQDKLSMSVHFDYQPGANDCCYWDGDIYSIPDDAEWDGGRAHTPIGINSFRWFNWHNWGSGYDDFEVEVERHDNGDGFTNGNVEDAVVTFTGGDYEATVTPSDGTASYTVPVFYNVQVELIGKPW